MKKMILLMACLIAAGCNKPLERYYSEEKIEPAPAVEAKGSMAMMGDQDNAQMMMDGSQMMMDVPQDDTHAMMLQNMPDDAIHAKFRQQMMNSPNSSMNSSMNPSMPMSPELERSVDRSPLKWKTPSGWSEQPGSGMRLATFMAGDVETSVVSLGGQAGGLEANIARWIRQIGIDPAKLTDFAAFVNRQEKVRTKSGLEAVLVDLTQLQSQMPGETQSMIAAVIDRGQSQIFLKMTGSKKNISAQLNNFRALLLSIESQ